MSTLRISKRDNSGVIILDLAGNIRTNEDYVVFKEAVEGIIHEGKVKIILNFDEVHFINSSGLGRLILAAKKTTDGNGTLKVINLSDNLKGLFSFTKLDNRIPVFASEAEAIADF